MLITVLTAYNPDSTVPTVHACVRMHGPKFSTAISTVSAAFCISEPSSTSSPSSKSSNTNSQIYHHNCHYHRHLYLAGTLQQSIHWQMQVGLLSHFDKTLIPAMVILIKIITFLLHQIRVYFSYHSHSHFNNLVKS